jgi:knotted carbamoyltransferase YgeW
MGALTGSRLNALVGRSMLLTQDWTRDEIDTLADLARTLETRDRTGQSNAVCADELAYAVFFDNSTRTKSAWAGAASRLGMRPVIVDGSSTQVAHGETAAETGAMLGMNSHALGIRHDLILGEGNTFMRDLKRGIDDYLEATDDARNVPVVNLQCDVDHPTQAMADLLWLQESFPDGLAGKRIAVSWAYSPSYAKPLSVPQGLITLLSRFGADLTLAHPAGYALLPQCVDHARRNAAESGGTFTITHDMNDAFADAHVVYPKSWGPMELMMKRVEANRQGDQSTLADIEQQCLAQNREHTDWICDEQRMSTTAGGNGLYMHCLPADIGDEVTAQVMDRFKVHVAREANKKVYVIMALLAAAKVPNLAQRLGL